MKSPPWIMKFFTTRWKVEPLKHNSFPVVLPLPFSPASKPKKHTVYDYLYITDLVCTSHKPNNKISQIKGIVHPKMKILSWFTRHHVVPNLYECICSAEHKERNSDECGKQSSSGAPLTSIVFFFPTMKVNGAPKQPGYKLSSEYLPLCSAEQRNSDRFGTTWGWVNHDRIFIFGWTIF